MKISIHSGNWEPGRGGHQIEAVVIHIMDGTLAATDLHFKTPGTFVSSHDGIGKHGELHEYVDIKDKAYHVGRHSKPTWFHMKRNLWGRWINANGYTYGIECEGFRGDPWAESQMDTLVERTREALDYAGLPYTRDRVISHHEIAIDKGNMSAWCDEIVRRLNQPIAPPANKVEEATRLLRQAIALLET